MEDYFKDSIEPGEFSLALAEAMRLVALLDERPVEVGEYEPFFLKESERILRNFDSWYTDLEIEEPCDFRTHFYFDEGTTANCIANEYNVAMLASGPCIVEDAFYDLGIDKCKSISENDKQRLADLVNLRNALFLETSEGKEWLAKTKEELGKYIDLS